MQDEAASPIDGSRLRLERALTKAVVNQRHALSCCKNPSVMLRTLPSPTDTTVPATAPAEPLSEYLLVCQARSISLAEGSWHFTLESADGSPVFAAGDDDIGDLNRLTLLAAVRGLEAIDGPSAVTLLSNNRYLIRSLSDSLPRWRENDFVWEHFGRRIDVQHADLWRRVDRALSIHRVQACLISSRLVSAGSERRERIESAKGEPLALRVDSPHSGPRAPRTAIMSGKNSEPGEPSAGGPPPEDQLRRWLLGGSGSTDVAAPRRRFTAADLMESA